MVLIEYVQFFATASIEERPILNNHHHGHGHDVALDAGAAAAADDDGDEGAWFVSVVMAMIFLKMLQWWFWLLW